MVENPQGSKTALLSVYSEPGKPKSPVFTAFAKQLWKAGWKLIASGGTKTHLSEHKIPVIDTADLTGLKPVLEHRVATLTPELHGGLMAEFRHAVELAKLGWEPIGLLAGTFYPLFNVLRKEGATDEEINNLIDQGGPALTRSACKGDRIVVVNEADFEWLGERIATHTVTIAERHWLQAAAAAEIALYTAAESVFRTRKLRPGS